MSKQESPKQIVPPVAVKANEEAVKSLATLREQEKQPVRGKFIFHELPGGKMEFPFKKYKGDQITKYELEDGKVYTIPLAVARHLNTNCSYPSYNYKNDQDGRPVMSVAEKVRRCSFQSLEFIDNNAVLNKPEFSALPTL